MKKKSMKTILLAVNLWLGILLSVFLRTGVVQTYASETQEADHSALLRNSAALSVEPLEPDYTIKKVYSLAELKAELNNPEITGDIFISSDMVISENLTIPKEKRVSIYNGNSFTVQSGATITVEGFFINMGNFVIDNGAKLVVSQVEDANFLNDGYMDIKGIVENYFGMGNSGTLNITGSIYNYCAFINQQAYVSYEGYKEGGFINDIGKVINIRGSIEILAGVVKGQLNPRDGQIIIYGGTFYSDPTNYVAEDTQYRTYSVIKNGDGTWTVTAKETGTTLPDPEPWPLYPPILDEIGVWDSGLISDVDIEGLNYGYIPGSALYDDYGGIFCPDDMNIYLIVGQSFKYRKEWKTDVVFEDREDGIDVYTSTMHGKASGSVGNSKVLGISGKKVTAKGVGHSTFTLSIIAQFKDFDKPRFGEWKECDDAIYNIYVADPKLPAKMSMYIGENKSLVLDGIPDISEENSYYPEKGYNCFWFSSDDNIVEVDQEGNIRSNSSGKATIFCYVQGKKCACEVTVKPALRPDLMPGQSYERNIYLTPGESANLNIGLFDMSPKDVYYYFDESILSVDKNTGIVTAKKYGQTQILCTFFPPGTEFFANLGEFNVYVEDPYLETDGYLKVKDAKKGVYELDLRNHWDEDDDSYGYVIKMKQFNKYPLVKNSNNDAILVSESGNVSVRYWINKQNGGKNIKSSSVITIKTAKGKTFTINVKLK